MTPLILFEYVIAVVAGLGLGALLVAWLWSCLMD